MKRGDIVLAAPAGAYGKPRPAVVVQSDLIASDSVLLCPFTSDLTTASLLRILVEPTLANGLKAPSQIMTEKLVAVPRTRCRDVIGRLDAPTLAQLGETLILIIGLID